jgi:hypothetical protein|tara:strand:+ start:733 stop:903 length:171 start_codon:yes stop_codon:yes gene_type:complete
MFNNEKFSVKNTKEKIEKKYKRYLLLNLLNKIEIIKIYNGKRKILYPKVSLNKKIK